ncbi:hypothetical protein ES706_04046 [subsurface metagenome]
MRLSPKSIEVLEVMAEEYENNPTTRLNGIPQRIVGAKAGCYLNNPMYEVYELVQAGRVRKIGRDRIILTRKGYRYIRLPNRRVFSLLKKHPVAAVSIIVGIIGIIVTVIALLK